VHTGVTYEARKFFNESQLLQVILGQMMITIISKSLIAAKNCHILKEMGLKSNILLYDVSREIKGSRRLTGPIINPLFATRR